MTGNPVFDWPGGAAPPLPGFADLHRLCAIVGGLKAEVESYLRAAADRIGNRSGLPTYDADVWVAALHAYRYGPIWWASRTDATALRRLAIERPAELDRVGEHLRTGAGNRAWNSAVASFVGSPRRHAHLTDRHAPPRRFHAIGGDQLVVSAAGWPTPAEALRDDVARFHLDDFAHLVAARLAPTLYGSHHRHLDALPAHLAGLTPGTGAGGGRLQHAAPTITTDLLAPLLRRLPLDGMPDAAAVDWLAEQATAYLLAEPGLYLTLTDRAAPSRPVTVAELAVLAQAVAYDHPAAEVEPLLFTRGGADGDALAEYPTSGRVLALASLTEPTRHESRHALPHRALRAACRAATSRLLREPGQLAAAERRLAAHVLDFLDYLDHARGRRANLYIEVGGVIGHTERPGSLNQVDATGP